MKKILIFLASIYPKCYNWFILHYKKVNYAPSLRINGRLRLFGQGRIEIGSNVTINSSMSSNPIGGDSCTIISIVPGATLTIGEGTGISNSTIVCHQEIVIGSGVQLGGGVKLYDTDFHTLDSEERDGLDREKANKKPIRIEDHAFIGAHSMILKGVTIGEGSIIGAGSVVTKSVPPGEVWGGNPAAKIR